MLSAWGEFFKQLPAILDKSSRTPLGITALAIVALAVVAAIFFLRSPSKIKLSVFIGILAFCTFVTNAVLVYGQDRRKSDTHRSTAVEGKQFIIAGRVADKGGQGIPRAQVVLEGSSAAAAHDDTDQYGFFRFHNVAGDPDDMRITVDAPGYRGSDFRLSSADNLRSLRITLDSVGAPISAPAKTGKSSTTVSGAVLDVTGRPIKGATVTLRGIASQIPPAFTDAKGAFQFEIPGTPGPGSVRIFVEAQGYQVIDQLVSANSSLRNIDIRLPASKQ